MLEAASSSYAPVAREVDAHLERAMAVYATGQQVAAMDAVKAAAALCRGRPKDDVAVILDKPRAGGFTAASAAHIALAPSNQALLTRPYVGFYPASLTKPCDTVRPSTSSNLPTTWVTRK